MTIDEPKYKKDNEQNKDRLNLQQVEPKTKTKSRLTIALKENLKKRKIQKRSRKMSIAMLDKN